MPEKMQENEIVWTVFLVKDSATVKHLPFAVNYRDKVTVLNGVRSDGQHPNHLA